MNQVKSKIYYLVSTGEVLTITSEIQGALEPTTKEYDMTVYPKLKDKDISKINYVELEYGTLETTFNNAKSYKVNIETEQLEVIYYTEEELTAMQQQNQEVQELNTRISDISQYLNSNEMTITDVEDLILKSEQNKITEGVV